MATSGATTAFASDNGVTSSQILDALKLPQRITRSLSGSSQEAAGCSTANPTVAVVRSRTTRSLSAGNRTEVAAITKDKPNIDLVITFEYDSAVLTPASVSTVDALGTALTDPQMKDCVFVLGGHTDAKGSDPYNQGPVGTQSRCGPPHPRRQI